MFTIGHITVTRHNSYNELKHLIANQIILGTGMYLPSVRTLSEQLFIAKSSISRSLILLTEKDGWLEKIIDGKSPRNCVYKIIATIEQAEEFKNYYLLPVRKKLKFRKMSRHAGQFEKEGQFEKLRERDNYYSLISSRSR